MEMSKEMGLSKRENASGHVRLYGEPAQQQSSSAPEERAVANKSTPRRYKMAGSPNVGVARRCRWLCKHKYLVHVPLRERMKKKKSQCVARTNTRRDS